MKITACRFQCAIVRPEDAPGTPGPDVVFFGRSNVGKSSLINRLLGVVGLARTSSVPGRTQTVSFYRVNESLHFVDLPGYGYARVPAAVRAAWKPMVEGVLLSRLERIAVAVVVVDARHAPMELDVTMREWLEAREVPYVTAATKADKLSGNGRARARRALRAVHGAGARAEPILVSAHDGQGIRELWREIDAALVEASSRPKGQERWKSRS